MEKKGKKKIRIKRVLKLFSLMLIVLIAMVIALDYKFQVLDLVGMGSLNYAGVSSQTTLIGKSIVEDVKDFNLADLNKINFKKLTAAQIIFISQWILLIGIIIFLYIRHLTKMGKEEDISNIHIPKISGRAKTDMDALYELIKERKNIKISALAKVFKINREKAIDLCKIFENQEMLVIDYPSFSEPEVRFVEEGNLIRNNKIIKEEKEVEYEEKEVEEKEVKKDRKAEKVKRKERRKEKVRKKEEVRKKAGKKKR